MDNTMKRHIGNISRQVGYDVSNRYSYIINDSELTNAYLKMRDELNYPLMIDSKNRRAIVYNKKGLEEKVLRLINEGIVKNISELENVVADDIVNTITSQLNDIVQNSNGVIVRKKKGNNSYANMLGKLLAKELIKGMESIIHEITDVKEREK